MCLPPRLRYASRRWPSSAQVRQSARLPTCTGLWPALREWTAQRLRDSFPGHELIDDYLAAGLVLALYREAPSARRVDGL